MYKFLALATTTVSDLGCLIALKTTVTDHLSKMHLQATFECMDSYLLAFTLLTCQAAKILLMNIWISLAMFASALQTTHPGTDRRQNLTRTPRLAQTIECIAHMLWLLLLILGHATSSLHSITAIYYATLLSKTQHAHIKYILMYHITCAILQTIPMIVLAVRQTIQLMMPPNTGSHRKFAHPKLRGGRYWRRIRYTQKTRQSQPL